MDIHIDRERASVGQSDRTLVEFFESPLTAELWDIYERATQSYACTRAFIEYFEDAAGATLALVASRRADEGRAAFLYVVRPDGCARVLGRFWAPTTEELAAFVQAVFERHPRVGRIETNLVDALPDARAAMGRPLLAVREATEMRISIPPSPGEWEARLGKKTLGHTRYHDRRLAREHPSARFVTLERADIPRSWIADIVRLNHERMASKSTESVYSQHYEEGIFRVTRAHGCVTVLQDGSRVCAGTIDVLCGTQAFGWVIGHDDAYGKFSPGRLCQMAAIRHYMDRGVRTIHLLHGESRHKRELGGKRARLASYVVLRSWAWLRPRDISKAGRKHLLRLVRSSIEGGDRVVQRIVDGRTPLMSFARAIARKSRRTGRR